MLRDYLKLENIFEKSEMDNFLESYSSSIPKKPLGILGANIDKFRVAEGIWMHNYDPICDRFKHLVAGITGLPIENQETPHLIKYEVGGEYKEHWDYYIPGEKYYIEQMQRGGQRIFSSILYLNDDFEGGETDFPKLEITVKPKCGSVFTWRNIAVDGSLKEDSLHAGLPVTKGIKYILIIWIHQKAFVRENTKKPETKTKGIKLPTNL